MRLAVIVIAGLLAAGWFVSRDPAAPAPAPARQARRADLSNLHAQVAAAGHTSTRGAMPLPAGGNPVEEDRQDIEPSMDAREADLSGLAAQLAAAEARDVEDPIEDPAEDDTIGHEIIMVQGTAPIIDQASVTHCGVIETDYIVNIPVPGRTFESVLGAAAGSQSQDDGISFSSGSQIENVYVVDDEVVIDD